MTFSHDIELIGIFHRNGVERRERKLSARSPVPLFPNMCTNNLVGCIFRRSLNCKRSESSPISCRQCFRDSRGDANPSDSLAFDSVGYLHCHVSALGLHMLHMLSVSALHAPCSSFVSSASEAPDSGHFVTSALWF